MQGLGRYRILRRLASGSLGDVFIARAEDPPSSAPLAITLLRPTLSANARFVDALFEEAEIAVRLQHPAAARFYGVESDFGQFFLVSELIQGVSLASILRRSQSDSLKPRVSAVAVIAGEILEAIHELHELRSLRDGSPTCHGGLTTRALMFEVDGRGRLVGVGPGRARRLAPIASSHLPYAAPEVLRGAPLSPASDVYALGLILCEALTGQPVHEGQSEEALTAAILARESSPPGGLLGVPAEVRAPIEAMLSARPEDRPTDLVAAARVLRSISDREPSEIRREAKALIEELFPERIAPHHFEVADSVPSPTMAGGEFRDEHATDPDLSAPSFVEGNPLDSGRPGDRAVNDPTDVLAGAFRTDKVGSAHEFEARFVRGLGRYKIESAVAHSATTTSYLASDPNLGRPLFIKAMAPALISDARLERAEWIRLFKREARMAGVLFHPALPALHDAGRDGETYFLVYQWFRGEPLSRLLEPAVPLTPEVVWAVLSDVVAGLAYLHRSGILHGDLRASNVLVGSEGGKLLDLSMAVRIGGEDHPLRRANVFALAPECLDGHPYTQRSEQFALGMLLYQMLVGARPFRGHADDHLAMLVRTSHPRPPQAVVPTVDPVLSEICMRLLEKDPMLRFDAIDAVADRLAVARARYRRARSQEARNLEDSEAEARKITTADLEATVGSDELAGALLALLQRATEIGPMPFELGDARQDPIAAAKAVARRLGKGAAIELVAAIAVAARMLAGRLRLSVDSDEIGSVLPDSVVGLLDAVDRLREDPASEAGPTASVVVQMVYAIETYFGATNPSDPRFRLSPRRAVLALKEEVGRRVRAEVVEALIDYLRELISALDLSPAPEAPRVLLAGDFRGSPIGRALEFDGFRLDEAKDGDTAWERLTSEPYRGVVAEASLPGLEVVSLVDRARKTSATADVPFIVLGPMPSTRRDPLTSLGGVTLEESALAVDKIRAVASGWLVSWRSGT